MRSPVQVSRVRVLEDSGALGQPGEFGVGAKGREQRWGQAGGGCAIRGGLWGGRSWWEAFKALHLQRAKQGKIRRQEQDHLHNSHKPTRLYFPQKAPRELFCMKTAGLSSTLLLHCIFPLVIGAPRGPR